MEQSIRLERRFAIIDEWLLDLDISDRAVRLYAVLARYADSETHKAYPSRDTLAERLRCSTKSVDRAAQELVESGAMTKQHRHNSSIVYTLRVVQGGRHQSPGGSSRVSRGVDTGVELTRTTELEPTKRELLNEAFNQFWSVYPKKDDKPLAKRSFEKALDRATMDIIIAGAERYRDDPNREPGFTKNPSTWLNADAWENGPLPSTRKKTNSERNVENFRAKLALLNEQPMKEVENGQVGNAGAIDFGVNFRSADSV
jgi:hypothetical protein